MPSVTHQFWETLGSKGRAFFVLEIRHAAGITDTINRIDARTGPRDNAARTLLLPHERHERDREG